MFWIPVKPSKWKWLPTSKIPRTPMRNALFVVSSIIRWNQRWKRKLRQYQNYAQEPERVGVEQSHSEQHWDHNGTYATHHARSCGEDSVSYAFWISLNRVSASSRRSWFLSAPSSIYFMNNQRSKPLLATGWDLNHRRCSNKGQHFGKPWKVHAKDSCMVDRRMTRRIYKDETCRIWHTTSLYPIIQPKRM